MKRLLPLLAVCLVLLLVVVIALLNLGAQERQRIIPQQPTLTFTPGPVPELQPQVPRNIRYPLTNSSPGIFSSIRLWQNKEHLLEQEIVVEGTLGMFGACTERTCATDNQCCNTCSGGPKLIIKDNSGQYGIPIKGYIFKGEAYSPDYHGVYEGTNISCKGNECTPDCYPFTYGENYRITAVVKARNRLVGKEYYLFLRNFERLHTSMP